MTGRDLIIYILENDLENEPIYKNGRLTGFINEIEAAIMFDVGLPTIRTWVELGILPGIKIGDTIYIPAKAKLKARKEQK